MPTPIVLHLVIRVARERQEAFLAFLREATPYYEQPGGIRIRLLRSRESPEQMIEVVEYASEEDFAKDQQRVEHDPTMRAYLERWRSLLEGAPRVVAWDELPAAGS